MADFEQMKECFFTYQYPNIHLLDDDGIADLFSAGNRKFLVKWILNIINENFDLTSDDNVSNILAGHGFCSEKKSSEFLEGKLDITSTLQILCKLFIFIKELKNNSTEKNSIDDPFVNITNDLIDLDLNLFPEYGPLRRWSEKEEKIKLEKYETELKEYDLDSLNKKPNSSLSPNLYKIESQITTLNDVLNEMAISTNQALNTKLYTKPIDFKFKDEKNIQKLDKNMEELLQFTADIDIIQRAKFELNIEPNLM
ncbi:unnamed protein product [Brassicogethes aeneus]|uniref:Uncharacterized protein n=1 Tax=Brassicogethes aeneus TaxID=1431903 RepID=A0A9P0ARP0_BRAAE|nr:unnamed protein product [Brassicogethes aeneus]